MSDPSIVLYQLPRTDWIPNASPFCLKLETYLRLAGHDYQPRLADLRKAPRGKAPWVELGGEVLADSCLIIDRLEASSDKALDRGLSAEQRAVGQLLRRTFEEDLYFIMLHRRWSFDDGFAVIRRSFDALKLPPVIRSIVPLVARRGVRKAVWAQGTARRSQAENQALARADLDAASHVLGDRPFVLGDRATTADATVWAWLAHLAWFPVDDPVATHLRTLENLTAYVDRIKQQVWADVPPLS